MRSQQAGRRYLAGLVVAAALVHVAAVALSSRRAWQSGDGPGAAFVLLLLGIVPAIAAILLARRGWLARDESSTLYSATGLVVLLAALILSHLGGVDLVR